jgi:F-type H+-transporting ATPase subunit delta
MDVGVLSMRYAKALMEFAIAKGVEEELYGVCKRLAASFRKEKRLRTAFDNPILTIEEKLKLIKAAAEPQGGELCNEFVRFARLVLSHHREGYLEFISLMYLDLYRDYKHIGVAKLITAIPIEQAIEEKIRNVSKLALHTTDMELNVLVNPEIEGGFIFDVNDYRLDASVATQLKRMKQQFIDKNRRIV